MEEFEKGTPDGVAIESDGHLRPSPGLTELATTPSTFVWSLACKRGPHLCRHRLAGNRVAAGHGKGEKPFTLFECRDLTVQALCIGPDGALYAATVAQRQGLQAQSRRHNKAG